MNIKETKVILLPSNTDSNGEYLYDLTPEGVITFEGKEITKIK